MAISKIKGVKLHRNGTSGARDTIRYAINKEKTTLQLEQEKQQDKTNDNGVENVIDYATNTNKTSTEEEILVTGYRCNPATAELEFDIYRQKYIEEKGEESTKNGKPNVAFHLIQSFSYGDKDIVTPQQMNEIGVKLAEKLGHYQAVVCTHVDKEHYHNHIVFNAYNMDELSKYHDCKETYKQIRDWNDELAKEYGLSVIVEPSQDKTHSYKEWLAKREGNSWKEQIRNDIDTSKEFCKSYSELVSMLEKAGYEIVQNKSSVSIKSPGNDKWVSDRRLGVEYTKASLEGYFEIMNNININDPQTTRKEEALKIKDFKVKNRNRIAPVSRWDSDGNRRGDIELNILYAIKIIKLATGGVITDSQNLFPNNPIFGSTDWKLQTLVDTLALVKDEDIKNENDLEKKLDELGQQLSVTKSKLAQNEVKLNESNKVVEAIATVTALRNKVKEYNVDELLKVEDADKNKIRENLAKSNPPTYQQRATLFKLLETNPDLKLAVGSKIMTKDEVDEVIEYLNDRTKEKPKDLIPFEEWDINRIVKKYDAIYNKINNSLYTKFGNQPMTENTKKAIEKLVRENNVNVDVNKLTQYDALQLFNYYGNKPSTLSPSDEVKPSIGQQKAIESFKDNPAIVKQLVKDIDDLNKKEASSLIKAVYGLQEPSILKERKMSEGQKKWLSNIIERNNIKLPYSIDEIDRGKAMEIINIVNANNYKGDIFLQNNNPATDKQKNLIEKGLKEGEHLTKNLERITKSEANTIINYIINGGRQPQYLISNKPIEYADVKDIELLNDLANIKGQKIAVSFDTLTKRDVSDAINFLTNRGKAIEFADDFIDDEEVKLLKERIDETKLTKKIEHITKEEFKEIITYTDNLYKEANIFKNSIREKAEPAQIEKLNELAKLHPEEKFYTHIDAMTKEEAQDTINYLTNKGRIPQCLSDEPINKGMSEKDIVEKIKGLPIEQQSDITAYRDAMKYLKNRGIDNQEQMDKCIEDNKELIEENNKYKEEMQEANQNYALNKKIQYNVNLVKNKAFTNGYDVEELLKEEQAQQEQDRKDNEEKDKKTVEEEVVETMTKSVVNIGEYVKGDVR